VAELDHPAASAILFLRFGRVAILWWKAIIAAVSRARSKPRPHNVDCPDIREVIILEYEGGRMTERMIAKFYPNAHAHSE
jgi:hypothetical protein